MDSDKPEQTKAIERTQPARLGGARADFVASLGRKVADTRAVLDAVETQRGTPSEKAAREELRRRLHAMGASARLLRFDQMARALAEGEAVLDQAAERGGVVDEDLNAVANVLDDLPALAWGEPSVRNRQKKPAEPPAEGVVPRSALVLGPEMLAEALTEDRDANASLFDCERTEDAQAALGLARALAPDVMLVDADVESAGDLVEALLDDPLTEPVPIVVVGTFRAPEHASRYIALGVAKAITKPVSAEALRRACEESIDQRRGVTMRVTLGEPTLEQLGNRLADEVRRAIIDSVDATGRNVRVPLGEGTEVLGAVWGAIARVREVVTARTDGAVRFAGTGPEGAIAVAPWLHPDLPGTDRLGMGSSGRGRGSAADVRLQGRRVVVADDDPGVTWFIADLLRTAGCIVHEALDGTTALDLCYRTSPELVVSDILMPGLDGFALARGLKRDVALRDTPVILLSWKEDLLQRVRELGASAAAYLRKESDSRAIVARVRECLRPRARIEARLGTEGEVRGRLDGLTVRSLLELVCEIRPNSRASVRDASFLYELEIREGAPRKITRTAGDGSFVRGESVLGGMLGIGAGRFTVATSTSPIAPSGKFAVGEESPMSSADGALRGTLAQMIMKPLAMARAAINTTTGARTVHVDQIALDVDAVEAYLVATPDPARTLVQKLADGASPRAMILGGSVDPTLLEDVLGDLGSRGAIVGVRSNTGADLFGPALEALLAAQDAPLRVSRSRPPPRAEVKSTPATTSSRPPPPRPSQSFASAKAEAPRPAAKMNDVPPAQAFTWSDVPPPAAMNANASEPLHEMTPSSLADAVMREISDRSPEIRSRSSNPPPIVEPSELRPRSSNPPFEAARALPSLPPDAIVPAAGEPSAADVAEEARLQRRTDRADPRDASRVVSSDAIEGFDRTDVDAPVRTKSETNEAPEPSMPLSIDVDMHSQTPPSAAIARGRSAFDDVDEDEPHTPLAAVTAQGPAPAKRPARWPFAMIGGLAAFGALAMAMAKPTPSAAGAGEPRPEATSVTTTMSGVPVSHETGGVLYTDLPAGLDVPPGQGLLDLATAAGVSVKVDGAARGNGPKVRIPLSAGPHEIQLKSDDSHAPQTRTVEVRAGYAARVDAIASP